MLWQWLPSRCLMRACPGRGRRMPQAPAGRISLLKQGLSLNFGARRSRDPLAPHKEQHLFLRAVQQSSLNQPALKIKNYSSGNFKEIFSEQRRADSYVEQEYFGVTKERAFKMQAGRSKMRLSGPTGKGRERAEKHVNFTMACPQSGGLPWWKFTGTATSASRNKDAGEVIDRRFQPRFLAFVIQRNLRRQGWAKRIRPAFAARVLRRSQG